MEEMQQQREYESQKKNNFNLAYFKTTESTISFSRESKSNNWNKEPKNLIKYSTGEKIKKIMYIFAYMPISKILRVFD